MSTTQKFQYWPSDGQLGSTKFTMPANAEDWPSGDALVGNFVYSEGKLVDFVDTKALITNESKSTTFPYDYVNIQVDKSLEDVMTFNQGERTKYFTVTYVESGNSGDTIVLGTKYFNCKTVDDVKAVDPDYFTNDIVDGVWSQSLADLENGRYLFGHYNNPDTSLVTFRSNLSKLQNGSNMFAENTSLTNFEADLSSLSDGTTMFYGCDLSVESVNRIADTIPTLDAGITATIEIGRSVRGAATTWARPETGGGKLLDEYKPMLKKMMEKGWTVTVENNQIALSDVE